VFILAFTVASVVSRALFLLGSMMQREPDQEGPESRRDGRRSECQELGEGRRPAHAWKQAGARRRLEGVGRRWLHPGKPYSRSRGPGRTSSDWLGRIPDRTYHSATSGGSCRIARIGWYSVGSRNARASDQSCWIQTGSASPAPGCPAIHRRGRKERRGVTGDPASPCDHGVHWSTPSQGSRDEESGGHYLTRRR
jgi:hypothetical protein